MVIPYFQNPTPSHCMRSVCFFLTFLFFSLVYGEIVEVQNFEEIDSHLTPETLVILDIDDTLLVPVQMLGCDEWFQYRLRCHQKAGLMVQESLERSLAEWESVRHLTDMEIVEGGSEKIVSKWQEQGYAVMGLTTQGLALATRTRRHLIDKKIDLSLAAPSRTDHYLTIEDHGVLFRAGILYTSGTHKGRALFALLKELNYEPKRILFVNDKHSHLLSIEETAKEKGIAFIGLRYAFSDERKKAFDEKIADYQFTHSSFAHLLSDEEAQKQLAQN